MTDSSNLETPCEQLKLSDLIKKIDSVPSISFPLIGELKGNTDLSLGTPSSCSLTFSLLIQITPLLGSLKCLFEILGVVLALKKFAKNPLSNNLEVIKALEKAMPCLLQAQLPCLIVPIQGTLQLIVNFLDCLAQQVEGLIKFQAKLDLESANNSPELALTLGCANEHAKTAMNNMQQSMQSVITTFDIIKSLGKLVDVPKLKDLDEVDLNINIDVTDPTGVLAKLHQVKDKINSVASGLDIQSVKSICCPKE